MTVVKNEGEGVGPLLAAYRSPANFLKLISTFNLSNIYDDDNDDST